MLGGRGDAEEGRVGADLDGLAVGHELEDPEPAVTAVSFPAAAEGLDVEHHLVDILSCLVLVNPVGYAQLVVFLDVLLG